MLAVFCRAYRWEIVRYRTVQHSTSIGSASTVTDVGGLTAAFNTSFNIFRVP